MDLKAMIKASVQCAEGKETVDNRRKSGEFVKALSKKLHELYAEQNDIAMLSLHHGDHKLKFGMNELLFDILICQYGTVISGTSKKKLSYIKRALWIVESELKQDKREALYDFNKLILGNAENKLFVGPLVHDGTDYRKVLASAAMHCQGNLFLAMIPHPSDWPDKSKEIKLWEWKQNDWMDY